MQQATLYQWQVLDNKKVSGTASINFHFLLLREQSSLLFTCNKCEEPQLWTVFSSSMDHGTHVMCRYHNYKTSRILPSPLDAREIYLEWQLWIRCSYNIIRRGGDWYSCKMNRNSGVKYMHIHRVAANIHNWNHMRSSNKRLLWKTKEIKRRTVEKTAARLFCILSKAPCRFPLKGSNTSRTKKRDHMLGKFNHRKQQLVTKKASLRRIWEIGAHK